MGAGLAGGAIMAEPVEGINVALKGSPISTDPGTVGQEHKGSTGTDVGKALRPFGIFLANHNQDTGLHFWSLDRWKREIDDT
jgi:hypothetical protein